MPQLAVLGGHGRPEALPPNQFELSGTACSSDGQVCTLDVCNGAGACTHPAGNAELVTINVLAVLFITSRLLYIICYLADWATLRSLVWFVGMALIVSFFVVST